MEDILRQAVDCEPSQPKTEAMCAAIAKPYGRTFKALGSSYHVTTWPDARHRATGFNVCPPGFWSYYPSFYAFIHPSGMGMFVLCYLSWK